MTFPHLPSSLSLANTTALVTGAGSPTGIGLACAVALGELGARVIVTGTTDRIHERVAELETLGIDAVGIVCTLDSGDEPHHGISCHQGGCPLHALSQVGTHYQHQFRLWRIHGHSR